MPVYSLVLLVAAFIVFVLAALKVSVPRADLVAIGLALWELAQIIARVAAPGG